jgi:hypothetical protein
MAAYSILTSLIGFANSGDFVRGKNLAILGQLLDRGVKVALMYGDRDYQCNCESTPSLIDPSEGC